MRLERRCCGLNIDGLVVVCKHLTCALQVVAERGSDSRRLSRGHGLGGHSGYGGSVQREE